ncbi:hypothetical protein MANY_31680 [Mycolicibacterium anyangense]|uniref:Uncharacterized protein n=1 Tax=Mycolicibacterium anyangense TaxID=1431246 RepID=A0A6N4WF71_9MYCO|nr:hypothetical protein MANY_31680 [Mycolicibacterium anyangense]
MLPISQSVAGWLLILAAIVVFVASFAARALLRRHRERKRIAAPLNAIRRSWLAKLFLGTAPGVQGPLDDGDIDTLTLIPAMAVCAAASLAGISLIAAESFGIELRIFTAG